MKAGRPVRREEQRARCSRVASRLRRAREDGKSWSRNELARHSEISPATITSIERGDTVDPGFSVVVALARALGVPLDELAAELS